ncbi:MAG: caspase family protein [Alphaproteobacteria bacterium]|nr:caspase family protein [Alphaproteobacteria bacterium]
MVGRGTGQAITLDFRDDPTWRTASIAVEPDGRAKLTGSGHVRMHAHMATLGGMVEGAEIRLSGARHFGGGPGGGYHNQRCTLTLARAGSAIQAATTAPAPAAPAPVQAASAIPMPPPAALARTEPGGSQPAPATLPQAAAPLPQVALLPPPTASGGQEPRLALVVGNGGYKDMPLANPVNDVKLVGATLRRLGFQVSQVTDADQLAMKRAIQEFGEKLDRTQGKGVGLFFYAGHGIQASGKNYLIPVGAQIKREADLEIEAVNASWVLNQMEYARAQVNIVILDACRNNPLQRSFRSAVQGLARMDAPRGTIVAYSTAPDQVAADGAGSNSPYSAALAQAMLQAGTPVEQMFKLVRRSVLQATSEQQIPWESSSLTGDFFFLPPGARPGG